MSGVSVGPELMLAASVSLFCLRGCRLAAEYPVFCASLSDFIYLHIWYFFLSSAAGPCDIVEAGLGFDQKQKLGVVLCAQDRLAYITQDYTHHQGYTQRSIASAARRKWLMLRAPLNQTDCQIELLVSEKEIRDLWGVKAITLSSLRFVRSVYTGNSPYYFRNLCEDLLFDCIFI